jgi:DNA-binding SARP family transcriptional activator/DNA-binding CsgD family transcriptional regulator/tetratricopeptide (TPR) repeat protein
MRVRLLGPVDVVADGAVRPVRGLRRKAVLAVLALRHGEVVRTDQLADAVWDDAPPATPLNTLQRHISYLRQVLGSRDAIVARPPGYWLDQGQVDTDVVAAERLIQPGAQVTGQARKQQLRDALALWRGQPLSDFDGLPWLREQAERLEQLRLRADRALVETRLALGEHEQVLPELEALTRDHPFDEQLHAQLMLALYRSGRQADALGLYRRLCSFLHSELAVEPGPPLRELQAAILRQDRGLDLARRPALRLPAPRLTVSGLPAPGLTVSGLPVPQPPAPRPPASQPPAPQPPAPQPPAQRSPDRPVRPQEPLRPARPATADTATPLLERDQPLAQLTEYAAQAAAGEGRLVLLGGEAGVGKSALVERLRQELPEARWSWSMCDGLFTPRPLGPLFDLADQLGGELLERCRAGADREELFRALLAQVAMPKVTGIAVPDVEGIAVPGTMDVLVVEDIHWADEATLDLLRYLSRRLRGTRALIIATYRDDALAAADQLRVALGDLGSQRCTRRIGLMPLSPDAVRELACGSGLPAPELYRLTGGNPFYVTEALRSGMADVPPSARDAVLARAARLSRGSREVLDVAALTGTQVEARLLESVTGCPPSVLDELLESGLLVGDGAWLRFRHEIARLAVAQAVAGHRSQAVHELVLAALRSFGCDDDARLAFHAEAAGDGVAVLRYAPAAARRAARLASHREAAAQYERALRFAAGADPATLAGLHEGLADEVMLLDRWGDAETEGERALALWREVGDQLREGDALRRLSRIRWNLCRGDEAVVAAEAAVSVLEPLGPSVELARAYATHANQRMLYADHDVAIDLALRAQALAIQFGATAVHSDALNTQAASRSAQGLDWAGQMRRALDIALAGGHHIEAGRAYTNLVGIHAGQRKFAEAERYLEPGIAFCVEHDVTTYAICMRGEQGNIMERASRWDEAVALSWQLLSDVGPSPANRLCSLIRLGVIGARRGEPQAWAYLDEATASADEAGEPQNQVPARLARAEAHWLEGDLDAARREAELAHDAACATPSTWLRGAVAAWLRRLGSPRPMEGEVAEPYRLLLDGDPAGAAAVWTRLGCPYDAAMALTDASRSEAALREALGIVIGLGAHPAARIIRQRLRALGARSIPAGPHTATRQRPFGLTRREGEVLDLICAEHTNAEIAAKLFISAKTVDHHVSAILAKLGVPSRSAARNAARLRLAGASR